MDRIACPMCGVVHDLSDMQVGFHKPDAWFALEAEEREARVAPVNRSLSAGGSG